MQLPSFDEFMQNEKMGTTLKEDEKTRELFLIQECPTPGCQCKQLHPIYVKNKITGFTCSYGCYYKVKRNLISGKIEYYELKTCNPLYFDSSLRGHRISRTGAPYIDWR